SQYFSLGQSLGLPQSGPWREEMLAARADALRTGIDEFVLSDRCSEIMKFFRQYISVIDEGWRVYRYEDVIFDKRGWVGSLAEYLRIELSQKQVEAIAARH